MKIIRSLVKVREEIRKYKSLKRSIGFVPTMGALHEGHASLMRKARAENDCVVVSIFVNPAQFGPKEDFKKYPRTLPYDIGMCKKERVDILFLPKAATLYPSGYCTFVTVEELSSRLCGALRPGHFRGVATVVAKLFNLVTPDVAYFGQKDAQQALIIKRMVQDLDIPVTIEVLPIVREKDGLALSSRNRYLNARERKDAPVVSESLTLASQLVNKGSRNSQSIIRKMSAHIRKTPTARLEYIAIVDPKTLLPIKKISGPCLVALAVHIGRTRLIDNRLVRKG